MGREMGDVQSAEKYVESAFCHGSVQEKMEKWNSTERNVEWPETKKMGIHTASNMFFIVG